MKYVSSLLLAFLLLTVGALAQSDLRMDWFHRIEMPESGVDEAWHIHFTGDGYILTGNTTSAPGHEGRSAFLMKLDINGILDTMIFVGDNNYYNHYFGYEFHPTIGGDYIFVGTTDSAGYYQILLKRVNSDSLSYVWEKTFGEAGYETLAYSVQYDPTNGGFIICGQRRVTSSTKTEVYLLFTDANGDSLWADSYVIGSDSLDVGRSVKLDGSGYAVTGYSKSNNRYSAFLLLTDALGQNTTSFTYGDANTGQFAESIKKTSDGGFILVGGGIVDATTDVMAIATKITSTGSESWSTGFGVSENFLNVIVNYGQGVIEKEDNTGFYLTGISNMGYSVYDNLRSHDVLLAEIDNSGNIVWERVIPDSLADYGYWIQPTFPGFVICGSLNFNATDSAQVFAMKFSPAVCGDVNGDGNVNILDLTYLDDYLNRGGPAPPDPQLANVDGDCPLNDIDDDDKDYLVAYMFMGGPAPICPWCFEE